MSSHKPSDKFAGFLGLIITTATLFVICFTIVQLTNLKFSRHEPAAAAEKK